MTRLENYKRFVRNTRMEGVPGRDRKRHGSMCRADNARLTAARPVFGGETYG